MRQARCGSSARRTRFARATAFSSRSTTTTRSTAYGSSRVARGAETSYVPSVAPDPARRRASAPQVPRRDRRLAPQSLRVPGAVELLRRAAPARVDRRRAVTWLGRSRRLRGVRCRRTGSTSVAGTRTSCRSPSTSCSATRRASAACSRGGTRLAKLERPWFSRRHDRRRRGTAGLASADGGLRRLRGRPPSTTSTCRRSRSGWSTSSRSAST